MADDPRKEAAIRAHSELSKRLNEAMAAGDYEGPDPGLARLTERLDDAMLEAEYGEYTSPALDLLPDDPSISEDTRSKHARARTQEFAGRLMRDAPVPEVTLQDRTELLAEQRARYEALPDGHPIKANLKRVMDAATADLTAREPSTPSSRRPGTYYYELDPEGSGARLTPKVPEPNPADGDALADYEARVTKGTLEKVVIPDPDDASPEPPAVRTIPKDPNAYKALLEMFGVTAPMGRERK